MIVSFVRKLKVGDGLQYATEVLLSELVVLDVFREHDESEASWY